MTRDDTDRRLDRRQLLRGFGATAATAATVGLAGCGGDDGNGGDGGGETTETFTDIQSDAGAVPGGAPGDDETTEEDETTAETGY
jgi:hypothetical protein